MVRVKEKQLGGITVLDKDGYSVVTNSGARLADVGDPIGLKDAVNKEYADSLAMSGGPHASTHQSGGGDQIDGYQLSFTYTPVNYITPSSNILGLHIKRIDDALGTFGEGTGDFLADGSVSMTGDFNAGGNNIINVNLVDGYSIPDLSSLLNNHSVRHEEGGADQIDGAQIYFNYIPENYENPAGNLLGLHLEKIDLALANSGGGGGTQLGVVQVTIEVESNGQTVFTLPSNPYGDGYSQMFVNGLKQEFGEDYSESGATITYTGEYELEIGDTVEFWYLDSPVFGEGGGGSGEISLNAQSVAANPTGGTTTATSVALSTNTILGRASGNVAAISPNDFTFENTGTSTKAGYNHVAAVNSIANSTTGTTTATLTTDGLYLFTCTVTSTKVGGDVLTSQYSFHATRASGALTGAELANPVDGLFNDDASTASDTTAAVTFSNSSGNLLVTITNSSGTTINSLVAVSWVLQPFPSSPV